jgi:hypothetical protein
MPDAAASRKRQIVCFRYLRSGCEHRRRRRAGLVRHRRQTIDNNKVCWPHSEFQGGQNPGRESPKRAGLALLSSLPLYSYKGCRHTIRSMPGEVIPPWARREADSVNERLDSM